MEALLFGAFEGDARAAHFGEAVAVVEGDAPAGLQSASRFFGIGFGPGDGKPKREVALGVYAHLLEGSEQGHGIARDDVDGGGLEDAHELDLAAGVARAGGDDEGPQPFGSVVQAEPAGEEAVAHHVLEDVALAHSHHMEAARDEVGPALDVAGGVEDRGGEAGGAGGVVEANHFRLRHGQQAIGVGVSQVLLLGEREPRQVVEGADRFRAEALVGQHLRVVRGLGGLGDCPAEPLELQRLQRPRFGDFDGVVGFFGWHPSQAPDGVLKLGDGFDVAGGLGGAVDLVGVGL